MKSIRDKSRREILVQIKASISELAEETLKARVAEASAERDTAAAGVEAANLAVEAAQRELAGAEAGDGRDESNRSLSERLRDAENCQVAPPPSFSTLICSILNSEPQPYSSSLCTP